MNHDLPGRATDEQSGRHADATLGEPADERRETIADHDPDHPPPLVLPANQGIILEIVDIGQRHVTADRAEHHPADVRVEEAKLDVVRICIVVGVLVMAAMIRAPLERGVLHRRGTEDEGEQPHRPLGLERQVREQPVIPQRDAQAGCDEHPEEHDTVKPPVNLPAKVVEKNRQTNERACHSAAKEDRTYPAQLLQTIF